MPTQTVVPIETILPVGGSNWATSVPGAIHDMLGDGDDATFAVSYNAPPTGTAGDALVRFALPTGVGSARLDSIRYEVRHQLVGIPNTGPFVSSIPGFELIADDGSRTITVAGVRVDELTVTPPPGTFAGAYRHTLRFGPPGGGYAYFSPDGARFSRGIAHLTYYDAPAVTVTAPTGPVTSTATPEVAWGVVSEPGVNRHRIKVYPQSVYGAPGFTAGQDAGAVVNETVSGNARTFTIPEPLPNDTYRVYVQAVQITANADHESSWTDPSGFATFTINVTAPAAPFWDDDFTDDSIAVVALQWGDGTPTSTPVDGFDLERFRDGAWERMASDVPYFASPGFYTFYDYRVTNGETLTYRVRSLGTAGGQRLASAWVVSSPPAGWSSDDVWVKVADPGLDASTDNAKVVPATEAIPAATFDRALGRFGVLGNPTPVVTFDVIRRHGAQFVFSCLTFSTAERDAIDALIADGGPFLLQFPPSYGEPDRWVVPTAYERQRLSGVLAGEPTRLEVFTFAETSAPAWPDPTRLVQS